MRRMAAAAIVCMTSWAWAQDPGNPKPSEPPAPPKAGAEGTKPATAEKATSVLDFTMKDIDGREVALSKYKGKVLLIVNVASRCGMTPQYEQLQMLHEKYGAKGLAVLAFPANNFGGQEPGTNEEIKSFCSTQYGVGFDLFGKVSVKGEDACELYKFLTSKEKHEKLGGEIKWNFTKFLVDRDGKVIERFEPRTKPDAPEVVKAIETALEKPAAK